MNTKMKLPLLKNHPGKLISSLTFRLCIWGQGIQPSWAEGSKELTSFGGDRPYIEWASLTTAGVARQTTLSVYVQSGEVVYLGSSVPTAANGGTQDIIYRSPLGGQNGSCNVLANNPRTGLIRNRTQELAGPAALTTGGYNACSFTATETGIYEVEFHAPALTGDPPPIAVGTDFATNGDQNSGVAAWDITVANGGLAQTGRVFTKYLPMNVGDNGRSLNSRLYIQTKDGYQYLTDMNGMDPFGFIFFANSRGFIDNTNNTTVYHSIGNADNNTDVNFPGNVGVQKPNVADTVTDITHLVFFNPPSALTLGELGIPTTAVLPVEPTSFLFTGGTGGSGNQAPLGVGGYFSFNVNAAGSYQIIIDTSTTLGDTTPDGIFDPSIDRVLQNPSTVGSNVVLWDGKDASGVDLPPRTGNAPYNAIITARAGEYHFPILDPETNANGFKIEMRNAPGSFSGSDVEGVNIDRYTIYYNDSDYTTADGTPIVLNQAGRTNPFNAARGINSEKGIGIGEHEFGTDYGNLKGIDTWTYFSSAAVTTPLVITTTNETNVRGTKSVRFLADNDSNGKVTIDDTVEYTITYSNLSPGNTNAINFIINDTLPSQLTFVSAAITSQTSGNTITVNGSYSGSGAVTNLGTLRVGDTISVTITAKIGDANSGNPISNQASADFNTADNPTAAVGTVYTDANSATATTNPPSVNNYFLQTADDGTNIGNDPTDTADDDPTLFTVVATPKLLLVKRITAINGTPIAGFDDNANISDPTYLDDNDSKWPAPNTTYLRGVINGGVVTTGDVLEYTIYFLSKGGLPATNVTICDLVPENTTFLATAFDADAISDDGVATAPFGIALGWSSSGLADPDIPSFKLTNAVDSDRAEFFDAGLPPSTTCAATNDNGAVVVRVGGVTGIPPATGSGTPTDSYGYIRFKATVK
jgi:uncharacterized repeat protein (TIGR01451 family)